MDLFDAAASVSSLESSCATSSRAAARALAICILMMARPSKKICSGRAASYQHEFEVADIGTKALLEPAAVMLCNVLLSVTTFSELRGM